MKPPSPPALGGGRPASVHLSAEARRLFKSFPATDLMEATDLVELRQGARGARGPEGIINRFESGSWLDRLCALE